MRGDRTILWRWVQYTLKEAIVDTIGNPEQTAQHDYYRCQYVASNLTIMFPILDSMKAKTEPCAITHYETARLSKEPM